MNYEKKYKEALERAKEIIQDYKKRNLVDILFYAKEDLEGIFPELKESEDEKIRKVLIDYFNRYKEQEECGIKTFFGIPTDNILAWLEKQGEQKASYTTIVKTGGGGINALVTKELSTNDCNDGQKSADEVLKIRQEVYQSGYNDGYKHGIEDVKQGEQKSIEWSKEDERIYYSILADIRTKQDGSTSTLETYYNEQISWLKSLKQRIGG